MREHTPRFIFTFHTTAEAMATEKACHTRGLEGKLVSAPRSLSADCGIAWSAPLSARDGIERAIAEERIEVAGFHELVT